MQRWILKEYDVIENLLINDLMHAERGDVRMIKKISKKIKDLRMKTLPYLYER